MTSAIFDFESINRNMRGDDWWKDQQHQPMKAPMNDDPDGPCNPAPMPCTTPGPIPIPGQGGLGKPDRITVEEAHQTAMQQSRKIPRAEYLDCGIIDPRPDPGSRPMEMLTIIEQHLAAERHRHTKTIACLLENKRAVFELLQQGVSHVVSDEKPNTGLCQASTHYGPHQQSPSRPNCIGGLDAYDADHAKNASKPIRRAR